MHDITSLNFETELIAASQRAPVLLDIWAAWCGPCKALGPVLEKLETDYTGRFVLAKLDADAEPEIAGQLSQMFGVRSIPFCVMWKDGQPVDGFVGALPEKEIRAFLDKHVPAASEPDPPAEPAIEPSPPETADEDPEAAMARFAAAVAADAADDTARYDYLMALLRAGRADEADRVFAPVSARAALDQRLQAAGDWLGASLAVPHLRSIEDLQSAIGTDKRDFQSRFDLAQRHFAAGEFTAAMDSLLEILMRDKNWKNEVARKTYISILEVLLKTNNKANRTKTAVDGLVERSIKENYLAAYHRKLSMAIF